MSVENNIYENVAEMFLVRYKDWIIQKVKETGEISRFQNLVAHNGFCQELARLGNRLTKVYDNPEWHSIVLETLDIDLIYGNVDKTLSENGGNDKEYTDLLVKELLRYFKQDFFKWVNQPDCQNCDSSIETNQTAIGIQRPTAEEARYECGNVEVYRCNHCGGTTRFPRYNNPIKLLETRKGRCGEFCNVFTLILKSFGLEARYIWNKEDHVWCEFYSTNLDRWVHVDPSEQSFDQPYIYSINWNKKMSYCIAFNKDGVTDVSRRYIIKNALERKECNEGNLSFFCDFYTKSLRKSLTNDEIYSLEMRDERERLQFLKPETVTDDTKTTKTEQVGRISGSTEWKKSRGEGGN
ncbi:hypothetical protein TPHA_0A01280 [Tetrapisispora phaffii CBS 4417]|uniref:Peptide:N-glycanase 1 n=1 Tax=Tetrapisispora phaffii (strain ATCC 24235 / CBS 4417 / NBRC 1672 / NRRL Y-8282 / UCD 70-5) TaxID=1071381 RepID=G8BMT4_TETPH|nr:hypothetical protein TPHA_0A01280 [Tetrapisispora phaffii CBS 4417]CCE61212.1 hypothetical protein TPHA_0A01280 [Tetrapisispora phaffii CBS 4417]